MGVSLKNPNPGNFAGVPEEMLEIFMKSDLTSREFRVVFFLFKEILKKQYVRELIKLDQFVEGTQIPARHLIPTIQSLIRKGIIKRQATSFRGAYFYEFREEHFLRVIATKEIYESKKGLKLLQGGKGSELPNLGNKEKIELPNLGNEKDPELPNLGNSPSSKIETDSLREIHKIPEAKPGAIKELHSWDKNNWNRREEMTYDELQQRRDFLIQQARTLNA